VLPGDDVSVDARLQIGDVDGIVSVIVEISSALPFATGENGMPDCVVNPAINKEDSTFTGQLTASIFSLQNNDPIPDGAQLFSCRVAVSEFATPAVYPVAITDLTLIRTDGSSIGDARRIDGHIEVLPGGPTPTPPAPSYSLETVFGVPGGMTTFRGVLASDGADVLGLFGDIGFNAFNARIVQCTTGLRTGFFFPLPQGCVPGATCNGYSVDVSSAEPFGEFTPIPDGSEVFECTVQLSAAVMPGQEYEFPVTNIGIYDTQGSNFERAFAVGGRVVIVETLPTPTSTRTGQPTATPTRPSAALVISTATAFAGNEVTIDVHLMSPIDMAAGAQLDIDAPFPFATQPNGRPDCSVNPAIQKNGTTFTFLELGCTDCRSARALVLDLSNVLPIPDGSRLFSCRIQVPELAAPGVYAVAARNPGLHDPNGFALNVVSVDGHIEVRGDGPTRTPTPPATPTVTPTSACETCSCPPGVACPGLRLSTPTAAAGDEVTIEARFIRGDAIDVGSVQVTLRPPFRVLISPDGSADCTVNPEIDKAASTFSFGAFVTQEIAANIFSTTNNDPLEDDVTLFSCRVRVPSLAAPFAYPLLIEELSLVGTDGSPVQGVRAVDGHINVLAGPTPPVPSLELETVFAEPGGTTTFRGIVRTRGADVIAIDADLQFNVLNAPISFCSRRCPADQGFFELGPPGCVPGATCNTFNVFVRTEFGFFEDGVEAFVCTVQVAPGVMPAQQYPIAIANLSISDSGFNGYPDVSTVDGRVMIVSALPSPTPTLSPAAPCPGEQPNTPTGTPLETSTATATEPAAAPTPSTTATQPPVDTPTVTPSPRPRCAGDCDGNRRVDIAEIITGVNIALGNDTVGRCVAFDGDANGMVAIAELIRAVNAAANGCPA
jgi:hypothetical protein